MVACSVVVQAFWRGVCGRAEASDRADVRVRVRGGGWDTQTLNGASPEVA